MFNLDLFLNLILILSGFAGLFLSAFILHKKRLRENLVCPRGFKCDMVIWSKYSKFFGIPLEMMGVGYYALIALFYSGALFFPEIFSGDAAFFVFAFSFGAFLLSLYLTFIQIFNLKQFCTWCLISASLSTIIFFISLAVMKFNITEELIQNRGLISAAHLLGVALGFGGAILSDVFFFKFLKDFRLSKEEGETLNWLSQAIWFALALLFITGIGLFLADPGRLGASPKFIAKMIIVFFITINGAFLNLLVAPKLIEISFSKRHENMPPDLRRKRRFGFALGAISIVSWFAAFALGALRNFNFTFSGIMAAYLALITIAVIISQRVDKRMSEKKIG